MSGFSLERCLAAAQRYQRAKALPQKPTTARTIERLRQKGIGTEAARPLASAAPSSPAGRALERIIASNDLTPIAFFARGSAVSRAVGRIVIRSANGGDVGYGTGFRISPRLIMTNNHVLADAGEAGASVLQLDYADGADGRALPPLELGLDPAAFFYTDAALDFSIVALDERSAATTADRTWLRLIGQSGKAIGGEYLNIIQHPGGRRQMIAFRNNRALEPIEDFQHYETDTEQGSSGSPVLNDGWELASLHHAGVPKLDAAGNALKVDGTPYRNGEDPEQIWWVANEGVRTSRIVAHMERAQLPATQRRLFEESLAELPRGHNGRLEDDSRSPDSPVPGGPVSIGPDGRAVWRFELSFGPAGSLPSIAPAAARVQSGAGGAKSAGSPQAPVSGGSIPAPSKAGARRREQVLAIAERLVERGSQRPYYDAEQDKADRTAYYEGPLPARGAISFDRLSEHLKQTHRPLNDYTKARLVHLYPRVDRQPSGSLLSIYSGKRMSATEVIGEELMRLVDADPALERELTESAGSLDLARLAAVEERVVATLERGGQGESSLFNCEHIVPQSWFRKREPMRSDLHHLVTCESTCNSFRSNIPYFDFRDYDPTPSPDEAVRDLCGKRDPGDDGKPGFEPEYGKGAVARATLYFLLRYPGEIGDEAKELRSQQLQTLLNWHESNEPSDWERHRNQAIFEIQGNRNPLIDLPRQATRIDFTKGFG